jgi:hypothetical protein
MWSSSLVDSRESDAMREGTLLPFPVGISNLEMSFLSWKNFARHGVHQAAGFKLKILKYIGFFRF